MSRCPGFLSIAMTVLVCGACESDRIGPAAPPPPTPTAVPPAARLQMSGRVLDENGAPVTDAVVEVDYSSAGGASNPPSVCPSVAQFCWLAARTTDMGEYSVEFEPRPWPGRGLGHVYAFRDGYEVDVQWRFPLERGEYAETINDPSGRN